MGVATGCGCKEVYTFPHSTYPYSSVLFYSSIPTFCSFLERRMRFFTSCGAYVNLRYIAMLYIHIFDWKSAVEHDGGV